MHYVGIDLHKKTISLCVVNQDREVVDRKQLPCDDTGTDRGVFRGTSIFPGGGGSHQQLRVVVSPDRAAVGSDGIGPPQQVAGHRGEHAEERQAGRPGPGGVPRDGHDPPGSSADAAAARTSPPGASPGADQKAADVGACSDAVFAGRLQRGPEGPCSRLRGWRI